jgi:paraquat-inducible protein B
MANASSVAGVPAFQAPIFDEASGVASQIQSQIGSVQNLFANVQQLLAEIAALRPPDANAFRDGKGKMNVAAYNQAVSEFQAKLNALNQRLEDAYRKLGQGQVLLARLQMHDLPAAQRRDAEKLEKAMKEATEALNGAAKVIADSNKAEDAGRAANQIDTRIEMRVRATKVDLRLDKDPSFKDAINAFAIMAVVVGHGRPEHKFTHMPPAAGGGLPPIGTA